MWGEYTVKLPKAIFLYKKTNTGTINILLNAKDLNCLCSFQQLALLK